MALTVIEVKSALPKAAPYKLTDGNGMYLLVTATGKYWRFNYRYLGKRKTLALGTFPQISLADARDELGKARKLLASKPPIDPSEARKTHKSAMPFAKSLFPDIDINALSDELSSKIKTVQAGDMAAMEAMLVGQAQALQTIFVSVARRATNQEDLKNYGMFMTLALKAQAQSRATIQALTELKYPKQVAFVKQANISHGHQQVNNGVSGNKPHDAHAREITNQSNELLEAQHGNQTLDTRATQTTIPKDTSMEAVGAKHGC